MHLALALRSAQRELGVMTPDSLKTENLIWLNRQVRPNGSFGNAYPYPQDSYDFWSATVGGLHFARLHAFDRTQPFWRNAERWLDDQPWPLSNNDKSYMMLWGLSAVLREATPQPVTALWHSGRDWFDDPAVGLRQKRAQVGILRLTALIVVRFPAPDVGFPGRSVGLDELDAPIQARAQRMGVDIIIPHLRLVQPQSGAPAEA